MRRKNVLLLVIATVLTNTALAAEEKIAIVKRPIEIYEGSSEANRMNKQFTATLGLTGVSSGYGPGTGVSIGYHLSRNQIVLIDLRSGAGASRRNSSYSYSYNDFGYSAATESKVNQIGVHYKHFFSNSFYVRGGADYSQVKYDYKWNYNSAIDSGFSSHTSYGFDGSAVFANVSIGNQWQWENFTLGCDWIGLSSSVAHKFTREETSDNADETDKINFEKDKKDYLTGYSGIALRFYLGATF